MRCHPLRWLWGLIPVAMLSWLAVHLESGPIERDLEHRSTLALAAAGYDWASVVFSGRDGLLVGRAADVGQRDRAAAVGLANDWVLQTRRLRLFHLIRDLFHYWHVFHKPFAFIMILVMIVHVAVALALGYVWKFGS